MELIERKTIEQSIFTLREVQVMVDFHLAEFYGVATKRLNEQVKRNSKRFPDSFMFQLTAKEWESLQSQIATATLPENLRSQNATAKRRSSPYVFTEQGIAMLSSVLNSEQAVEASIQIMQAFVNMRKFLLNNASIFQRLDHLELKQLKTDEKIEQVFKALEAGKPTPDKGIFFQGQIFDAYTFVSNLIRKAQTDIIVIDNYIDDSLLTLLSKRKKNVQVSLYTKNIGKQLRLDLEKHNQQYPGVNLIEFRESHDRFLLIDRKHLYHFGASLKDLGKNWFAFSQMDSLTTEILLKLKA